MRPVFVFGSNEAGRHGRGAALHAREHYGAKVGVGVGRTGNAYAIPTKDPNLVVLSLQRIEDYVDGFIEYARANPFTRFNVTRVGCGHAGYDDVHIAPLFHRAPANCTLPEGWRELGASLVLGRSRRVEKA